MSSLRDRFEEIIHMNWGEFIQLEKSDSATVDDEVLCSLIRACAETDDISAIKLAFDRIDGLQETPIEIKVPKFYVRFINATEVEGGETKELTSGTEILEEKEDKSKFDPATAKLRATLQEMRKMPKGVIRMIRIYRRRMDKGNPVDHEPKVKSVIVANLLKNVQKGKFKAVELVFDQIDGKLTRTITLLGGDDVYVDDYNTLVAPVGSLKDENGYYIAENKIMTNAWIRGFSQSQKGLEHLAERLDDE